MKLAAHMARRLARTRRRSLVVASASITTLALFVWSPGAWASAGCTTSTPSLGQTIICNAAGTQNITIPDGANAVELIVIGGGGGGGARASGTSVAGGDGGAGARVSASLRVSPGGSVTAVVGSQGSGGSGGGGGSYSSVVNGSTLLAVAGGGGGGGISQGAQGGAGGSGAAAGTPAGGSGADTADSTTNGGGGGNAGVGGAAGIGGSTGGVAGLPWSSGGAGGAGSGGDAGSGGSGYGGGGGGGNHGGDNKARPGGGAGGSFANEDLLIGEASFGPSSGDAGSGGAGGSGDGAFGSPGTAGWIQIRFIFIPSNTSGTPTRRSLVLTFDLPEGVSCSFKNVEASLGTWVQLPGAQDCTTSSADGPTLLGWATQADFPVQIAQRQVTNGWGAYETFNESGALTGVFIPAGGFTVLSADTGLYPIWS